MRYRQSIERCVAEGAGAAPGRRDVDAALARAATVRRDLAGAAGSIGFLAALADDDDLAAIDAAAGLHRDRFDRTVVLGTGGSSLGGQALVAMADSEGRERVAFVDNADPVSLGRHLAPRRLEDTGFLAISKSGGTAETLAQTVVVVDALRRLGGEAAPAQRLTFVVQPGDSPMRRLAGRLGAPVIDHPPGVGGRYSALTVTGLLPAAIAGLDPAAIRAGAREVVNALAAAGPHPAELGAAAAIACREARGHVQNVLMPYGDRLWPFAMWWRQLWAESLGKDGLGLTPIASLGAVDQHSQLQLYLGGPADKLFTVLSVARHGEDLAFPDDLVTGDGIGYLRGRTMGDLLNAMARATADTLTAAGRPVRKIELPTLDPPALGALMTHFMLETVIAARLLGVDPFDQPAVEDGKVRARRYLSGDVTA